MKHDFDGASGAGSNWFQRSVCGKSGTVRYRVEDACGNAAETSVNYDVHDDTPSCSVCKANTKTSKVRFHWIPNATLSPEVVRIAYAPTSLDCGAINTKWMCQNHDDTVCVWLFKLGQCVDGAAEYKTVDVALHDELEVALEPSHAGVDFIVGSTRMFAWTSCGNPIGTPKFYRIKKTAVKTELNINDRVEPTPSSSSLGYMRVAGFERSDGTTSASCAEKPPCVPETCHGINACAGGLGSLQSISLMYLGWNPEDQAKPMFSQREASVVVTKPGPMGKSPMKMYVHKEQKKMTTTDLRSVQVGQVLEFHGFDAKDGNGVRLPPKINMRLDNGNSRVVFDATCHPLDPIRVGDRFGSMLVTGYKSAKKRECSIHHTLGSHLTSDQHAGITPEANQADGSDYVSGGSNQPADNSEKAVLAGGVMLVVVAALIALVAIRRKFQGEHPDFDDNSSQATSKFTTTGSLVSQFEVDPVGEGRTAMDLMNDHWGDDVEDPERTHDHAEGPHDTVNMGDTASVPDGFAWDTSAEEQPFTSDGAGIQTAAVDPNPAWGNTSSGEAKTRLVQQTTDL